MAAPFVTSGPDRFGARRSLPRDAVIHRAEGAWLYDVEGHRYLDCLTVTNAANQGHRHPHIMRAMAEQAARMTLASRSVSNDQLEPLLYRLQGLTAHEVVVLRHSTVDAATLALDAARLWGAHHKSVRPGDTHVIACQGNGLGMGRRASPEPGRELRHLDPPRIGVSLVRFGDAAALSRAMSADTVAFVVEPVQDSAGLDLPPEGYLGQVARTCARHDVLLIVDETQAGFGRTGHLFAHQADGISPDMLLLGGALSGGFYPVSAVTARGDVADILRASPHDAAFVQNPLGCAVALAAIDAVLDERLPERSRDLGRELLAMLREIQSPLVRDIRGRGLWVTIELTCPAHAFNEALMDDGVAVSDARDSTIRLSPALTVTRSELTWLVERVARVLDDRRCAVRSFSPRVA